MTRSDTTETPSPGAAQSPARAWLRTIAVLAGTLAIYVALALVGTLLTGDAIVGAAMSNVAAAVVAIAYRWRSTGTPLAPAPRARARTVGFWVAAIAALVVCWTAGQAAALWVYSTWGSAAFDAVNSTKMHSPALLVVITAVILAPLGEEALIRGTAYPALRRHWPPLASAFVTASVFALLHGNLVQIVLTVPLGILLAFVYEAAQRLWPVVIMHVLFNLASSIVPPELVRGLAHPVMILCLTAAVVTLLFALIPGRYTADGPAQSTTAGA